MFGPQRGVDDQVPHALLQADLLPGPLGFDLPGSAQPRLERRSECLLELLLLATARAEHVAEAVPRQRLQVLGAEHAPVAYQHRLRQPEAALQLLAHLLQRAHVHGVAFEHPMRDGQPLLGHGQPDHDLSSVVAMVTGVPEVGQLTEPLTLEVGRGHVVEDQLQGQAEELGDPKEELVLDLLLPGVELVHGSQVLVVAELRLPRRPLHPRLPTPAPALAVALHQGQLAPGITEPVHHHPEDGFFQQATAQLGQQLRQAQLLPESTCGQWDPILAGGQDPHLTQAQATSTLGGGELTQMLDQAVDFVWRQLVAAAECAQDLAPDRYALAARPVPRPPPYFGRNRAARARRVAGRDLCSPRPHERGLHPRHLWPPASQARKGGGRLFRSPAGRVFGGSVRAVCDRVVIDRTLRYQLKFYLNSDVMGTVVCRVGTVDWSGGALPAPVAHRTERAAPDRKAGGSIPSRRTTFRAIPERWRWQRAWTTFGLRRRSAYSRSRSRQAIGSICASA